MADPLDIFGTAREPEDPLDAFGTVVTPQERLQGMKKQFPGAMYGLNDNAPPGGDTGVERQGLLGAATDRMLSAWKSGYLGLADLATRSRMVPTSGPLKEAAERAEEGRKREMGEFAEATTRRGVPPVATALADTLLEVVDPLDLVGGVAGSVAPAARLLRRGGRAAPRVAREVPEGIEELAAASQAIGASGQTSRRVADVLEEGTEGAVRRLTALDEAGNPLGGMTFTAEPGGGFRIQDAQTGVRGSGGMRAMMQKAQEVSGGPYLGSMAETDEGAAALARLRETNPDLFPERSQEAGFIRLGAEPKPKTPEDEVLERFDSRYFSRESPRASVTERLQSVGQRVRDEMEDELQPILRSVRKGGDPVVTREMEELLQQVRAAPTRSEVPVVRHTTIFDAAAGDEIVTGGSLLDVLRGHDEELLVDAERYMAAQRNKELADRAARGAPLSVSGESVAEADQAIGALQAKYGDRIKELDQVAEGYRDWAWRAQVEPLIRVGVYTEDEARRIADENTLYAIFDRVDRDLRALGLDLSDEAVVRLPGQKPRPAGGGGPRAASPVKAIHGGLSEEGKIQGIFESSALQAMRVQKFVDRQMVKNMLGKLGDEVAEVPVERVSKKIVPVAQVLDEAGEAKPIFRAKERGGNTFVRYEDGQRIEYAAPPDVLDALGRLTPVQASTVLAPARLAAQALRAGAVEIPSFAVFNVIRDSLLAPIYSRHGMIPGYDVARTAVTEVGRRLRGKGPSEAWQVAEEFGGFATMMDVDRVSMRRAMQRARTLTKSGGGGRRFLSEWARNPLLPFHVVGASMERLNRATEVALALRGGRKTVAGLPVPGTLGRSGKPKPSRRSIGLDAADITLNFMRGGRVGKPWNRYEAFSNAMLQDVSKFAREMRQKPFETTVRALAFVGVPSLANYALNRDDPDYQRLPEWERALFYHPAKLPNGWWVRVPRPLGLVSTFFGYGSHKAAEALMEEDPAAGKEFLSQLVRSTPAEFLARPMNLLPNAVQPAVEASPGVNYSQFLERPVVPEHMADWPNAEQYTEHTSPTMVDLGQALEISPSIAQYVFEAHTGTLGRESLATLDRIRTLGGESPESYLPDAKDIPLAGRFLSRPAEGFQTESVRRFYDLSDEAMGARSAVRSRHGTVAQYPASRLGLQASRYRRQINELSDRMAAVRSSKLSDEAKRERLRKLAQRITRMAESYIEQHERVTGEAEHDQQ